MIGCEARFVPEQVLWIAGIKRQSGSERVNSIGCDDNGVERSSILLQPWTAIYRGARSHPIERSTTQANDVQSAGVRMLPMESAKSAVLSYGCIKVYVSVESPVPSPAGNTIAQRVSWWSCMATGFSSHSQSSLVPGRTRQRCLAAWPRIRQKAARGDSGPRCCCCSLEQATVDAGRAVVGPDPGWTIERRSWTIVGPSPDNRRSSSSAASPCRWAPRRRPTRRKVASCHPGCFE